MGLNEMIKGVTNATENPTHFMELKYLSQSLNIQGEKEFKIYTIFLISNFFPSKKSQFNHIIFHTDIEFIIKYRKVD